MKGLFLRFFILISVLSLLIPSIVLLVPSHAHAFGSLTENGTAAFMGIGVNPTKILHVSGTGPGTVPLFVRGSDSAGFIIERTPTNRWVLGVNESPTLGNGFVLSTIPTGNTSVPRLLVTPDGKVGIGTINPDPLVQLSVVSNSPDDDAAAITGQVPAAAETSGIIGRWGPPGSGTMGKLGYWQAGVTGLYEYNNNRGYLGTQNAGVVGVGTGSSYGVRAWSENSSSYAGYFEGNVNVTDNLSVGDNLTVGGKLKYSAARTHYYSLPAADFDPANSTIGYSRGSGSGVGAYITNVGTSTGAMSATVHLPDDAIVTEFKVYFYDTSGSYDLSVYLNAMDSAGNFNSMSAFTSAGISGYGSASDTSIDYAVIDNANNGYMIWAVWPSAQGTSLQIMGARITYTINEAE